MLRSITAFELRYHLRSPLFFISFALFFLLAFGATVNSNVHIGSIGNVHVNSPFAIAYVSGELSMVGVFVLVAFVANAVIRDDETAFAPIIRATRINKLNYLLGRFIGATLVSIIILSSVPLAILIGSLMPWVDPDKIGVNVLSHYVYALGVFVAPTVITMGAMFFALATATRSMMWTYVGVVAFIVGFTVAQSYLGDPEHLAMASLMDPSGLTALDKITRYWTATERNSLMPGLTGVLLMNRIIWTVVAVAFFALAYTIFSIDQRGAKKSKGAARKEITINNRLNIAPVSATHKASVWKQFVALTKFDLAWVLKSPAFFVLLVLGVFNTYGTMHGTIEYNGTQYFPVTRVLVTILLGGFTVFSIIIAIYYSGELVWRNHDRRIHEIIDSTPAPNWAFMVPKILAIALILLACFAAAVVTACAYQLFHGYSHLQLNAYLLWFVLPELIQAILFSVLAVFVQTLVPHKALGWGVMLLYIVGRATLNSIGFEHILYQYGSGVYVPLSDMNGMGRFWIRRAWVEFYWLTFALMMLAATQLLWRRGVDTNLMPRIRRMRARFTGSTRAVMIGAAAIWLVSGIYIFYNTNILNEYHASQFYDKSTADKEKQLLKFESLPQPTITDVKLNVNIEPHQVRVRTIGEYVIENRTNKPLNSVHVNWQSRLKLDSLEMDGATLNKEYKDFNYRIYDFNTSMQPGEKRTMRFSTTLEQRGFSNGDSLTSIVDNGTFVNNFDISPGLGITRNMTLHDRSKRRKYGLPPELEIAKLEDESANSHHYLRNDSDWVSAQLTVTTDADQTPIAPGYQISDTIKDNRRTIVTYTEAPIAHFFSIQSARYAVKKDTWHDKDGKAVELAVYYYPEHDHNIDRMLKAMKVSLETFSEKFSPYQFHQARVLEFPAYASFAQSFANTIPYSEGIGFIQNFDESKSDEHIDMVTYITAHEIAHQWWGHQIIGANKQGMTLLSETFAQYSALLVMEKMYGKEQIRKFLKNELDQYLRARGTEMKNEMPMARVENQPYIHYQKGSLAMYWLKEVVGEEVVNQALRDMLSEFAFKAAPYPSSTDFLEYLRARAGKEHDQLISDLFEKITLYDLKASNATVKRLPDGKYQVTFTVEAKKLYADGQGKETEVSLSEPFDVGVFEVEPGKWGYKRESVILLDRCILKSGKQTVSIITEREPKYVGVDPFNMRIDRNSDDNVTAVTMKD